MHVDVYQSTSAPGPYLLVRRDTGRMSAPDDVRANFVPGRLVKQLRIITTDEIVGLKVPEALEAIRQKKFYVAPEPVDFDRVVGKRLFAL